MDFLKQKGPLAKRLLQHVDLHYFVSVIKACKPSECVDRTSMEWDVVLFSGIFAVIFMEILSDFCWLQIAALHGKH